MTHRTGIIVLGHTRPVPLRNLLESLRRQGALRHVSVWLDGHHGRAIWKEKVAECQQVVADFSDVELVEHKGHLGIEKLMLDALSVVSRRFERVIVLEDDCFPTRSAIRVFEQELDAIEERDDVYSVYGSHFLTPAEGETITRFQGWGWATTTAKLAPILEGLKACFAQPEPQYLEWVRRRLTDDVRARLDVTPGRDVLNVLQHLFSWDSCTALLTAMQGLVHKKTSQRVIFNCGMGPDSGHFEVNNHFRKPPFNMITQDEVWDHFQDSCCEAPRAQCSAVLGSHRA